MPTTFQPSFQMVAAGLLFGCLLQNLLPQDAEYDSWNNEAVSYNESGFYGSLIGPVRTAGKYSYAAVRDRLEIWEDQGTSRPRIVGALNVVKRIENLLVEDSIVYLVTENDRLCIVDARDPSHPRICSSNKVYCTPAFQKCGKYIIHVPPDDSGSMVALALIDVSDPGTPHVALPAAEAGAPAEPLSEDCLYCAAFCVVNDALWVIDEEYPPSYVSMYDLTSSSVVRVKQWEWKEDQPMPHFSIIEDRLIFSMDENTREDLGRVDELKRLSIEEDMYGDFDESFLKCADEGKLPIAVSDWDPQEPDSLKTHENNLNAPYPVIRSALGVVVAGSKALVTDGQSLFVFDITTLEKPKLIGKIELPETIGSMELRQGWLILQGNSTQIAQLDSVLKLLGDSGGQPKVLPTTLLAGETVGMAVGDDYCVCWTAEWEASAFDIKALPDSTPIEFALSESCDLAMVGRILIGVDCGYGGALTGLDIRTSRKLNLERMDVGEDEELGAIEFHKDRILISGSPNGLIESASELYRVDPKGELSPIASFSSSGVVAMTFNEDYLVQFSGVHDTQVATQYLDVWSLHGDVQTSPHGLYMNSMLKCRYYHPLKINQMAIHHDVLFVAADTQGLMVFRLAQ